VIVYATSTELATWTGVSAPANATSLLRSASLLVAAATGRDPYTEEAPSGATAEALRDATTAQAAAWSTAGVDPSTSGLLSVAPVKRSSIGTGTVERDTALLAEAMKAAATELSAEARAILIAAGLLLVPLPVGASTADRLLDYGLAGTWPHVVPRNLTL